MSPNIPGFQIKRTIGKGGMATVFLALQESLHRTVALKTVRVMAPEGEGDPAETETRSGLDSRPVERLIEEARTVASLAHPNIVSVFDIGATEECLYIAMEYLEGGDLSARIASKLSVDQALRIASSIGLALGFAHRHQVIHRDIKPANILFRGDDTPVLSDFGVAKRQSAELGLTQTGTILGSPFYMSPEQAEGEPADHRSDIYSLGLVLFEMLTGRPPYRADTLIRLIMLHLQAPVPELPHGLERLQPVLNRMLAKRVEDRYADAASVVADLDKLRRTRPLVLEAAPRAAPESEGAVFFELIERLRNAVLEDLESDRLVLPSLPEVALKVRETLARRDVSAREIARVVSTDPALSARLLRVANSALYGGAASARDLNHAVVRLGDKLVAHVVNLLVVAQLYDTESRRRIRAELRDLWQHSIAVATLSERIARHFTRLEPQVALLGGLIHDIGKLPILAWADQIPHVLADSALLGSIMARLHVDLGRRILEDWQYAPELVAVVSEHENIARHHDGAPDYADVVLVANLLSKAGADPQMPVGIEWERVSALGRIGLSLEGARAQVAEAAELGSDLSKAIAG